MATKTKAPGAEPSATKIKFDAVKLQEIMNITGAASRGGKALFPVLPYITLKGEGSTLIFESFGEESGVRYYYALETKTPQKALSVPSRELRDLSSRMEGTVVFDAGSEDMLHIESGNAKYHLRALSPEEVSEFPYEEETPKFEMEFEARELKRHLQKTVFTTGAERDVEYARGVLLHELPGTFRLVSTDGFRLAMIEKPGSYKEEQKFILDGEGIRNLARILPDGDAKIELIIGEKYALFRFPDFQYFVPLLNTTFPDYETILGRESPSSYTFERIEFMAALNRITTLTRHQSKAYIAIFNFTKNGLVIDAESDTLGRGQESLKGKLDGEEKKLALNTKFVLDYITNIDDEALVLKFKDSASVCHFLPVTSTESRYYLMPVKHPTVE